MTKNTNPPIPAMCKLDLNLRNTEISDRIVVRNAPRKKKYNSGVWCIGMLCCKIRKNSNAWATSGNLR